LRGRRKRGKPIRVVLAGGREKKWEHAQRAESTTAKFREQEKPNPRSFINLVRE